MTVNEKKRETTEYRTAHKTDQKRETEKFQGEMSKNWFSCRGFFVERCKLVENKAPARSSTRIGEKWA